MASEQLNTAYYCSKIKPVGEGCVYGNLLTVVPTKGGDEVAALNLLLLEEARQALGNFTAGNPDLQRALGLPTGVVYGGAAEIKLKKPVSNFINTVTTGALVVTEATGFSLAHGSRANTAHGDQRNQTPAIVFELPVGDPRLVDAGLFSAAALRGTTKLTEPKDSPQETLCPPTLRLQVFLSGILRTHIYPSDPLLDDLRYIIEIKTKDKGRITISLTGKEVRKSLCVQLRGKKDVGGTFLLGGNTYKVVEVTDSDTPPTTAGVGSVGLQSVDAHATRPVRIDEMLTLQDRIFNFFRSLLFGRERFNRPVEPDTEPTLTPQPPPQPPVTVAPTVAPVNENGENGAQVAPTPTATEPAATATRPATPEPTVKPSPTETPRPSTVLPTYGGEIDVADITAEQNHATVRRMYKLPDDNFENGTRNVLFITLSGSDSYHRLINEGRSLYDTDRVYDRRGYFFEVQKVQPAERPINGKPAFYLIFSDKNNDGQERTVWLKLPEGSKVWTSIPWITPIPVVYEVPNGKISMGMIKEGYRVGVVDDYGFLERQIRGSKVKTVAHVLNDPVVLLPLK